MIIRSCHAFASVAGSAKYPTSAVKTLKPISGGKMKSSARVTHKYEMKADLQTQQSFIMHSQAVHINNKSSFRKSASKIFFCVQFIK